MEEWAGEYLQLITDCEDRESRLSDWDRTFVDSLKVQLIAGKVPTPKQCSKLDEIWERVTEKG